MKQHPSSINAEKPREFWINAQRVKDPDGFHYITSPDDPKKWQGAHVIEYSAYEQVVKERDEFKREVESLTIQLKTGGQYF